MTFKNFLIGGIAGGLVFFFLGWVAYALVVNKVIEETAHLHEGGIRNYSLFYFVLGGKFFTGLFMSFFFMRAKVNTIESGALIGAIFGFFMAAANNLIIYSTISLYSFKFVWVDTVAFMVISCIAGIAIVLVSGIYDRSVSDNS